MAAERALDNAERVLDNATWESLTGAHAQLAERHGRVVRYPVDVSPFAAVRPGVSAWDEVAELAGAGNEVFIPGLDTPPPGWETTLSIPGVQLVDAGVEGAADPEAVRLAVADVPEMLALAQRTRPGPFLPRTIELGTYLGIRRGGELVAMAGERLHPPGWTEISAVCTDESQRGQGLATRLVRALVAGIRERGERPFLHTPATNTNAIRLYQALGFHLRRRVSFTSVRVPEPVSGTPGTLTRP
ncbi:acetyltransferase [Actinokineospora spheciospongiae]|uniref:Acetyltransferase n=1 Tax=Actinokineospora spheciospongiae TaxID=909613 RepID=W7JAV2_9PSEU|nr:GNAT family N-acetyltransferase [Actinokineospora spheciospongiae]EWC63169.1 acetyltransferase [Actinokineospora spheciospongiae]